MAERLSCEEIIRRAQSNRHPDYYLGLRAGIAGGILFLGSLWILVYWLAGGLR